MAVFHALGKTPVGLKNKTSFGLDGMSAKVLKAWADVLVVPLTRIVNTSFATGVFPKAWKTAKVIPMHKKGDKKDKANYRPVSLLPVLSKVIESLARKQLSEYFEKNGLLPEGQHGFRPGRSTTTALLAMHDDWSMARHERKVTAALFWDLTAAFDTLQHDLLVKKLQLYGLDSTSLKWFESFLEGRKQHVEFAGHLSGPVDMPCGTPQGSILSPLLFTIFVADLPQWTVHAKVVSYADDTSSYVASDNIESAVRKLEEDAVNILSFMASNGLVANAAKTEFVVFGGAADREPFSVRVGDVLVQESETVKVLGVTLNRSLSWRDHLFGPGGVYSTIQQRLLLLRRLLNQMPRNSLLPIVDGLIMSKIRYALALFGRIRLSESDPLGQDEQKIQVALNDTMRLLCGVRRRDCISIKELTQRTGLLSFNQLSAQATLMGAWKGMAGKCLSMEQFLQPLSSTNDRVTRAEARRDLTVPRVRNCFRYNAAKVWNKAPLDIRNARSLSGVKKCVKNFVTTLPV